MLSGTDHSSLVSQFQLSLYAGGQRANRCSEETQRAPGLLALSPTYAQTQMMNPTYQKVCEHFLTTRSWFWWGDVKKESVSKPYVHSCTAMRIGPGGKAQPLHRDDYINHNIHQEIDSWDDERDMGRETSIGLFVAGSKITKENGGTQFIPRSHLWYVQQQSEVVGHSKTNKTCVVQGNKPHHPA